MVRTEWVWGIGFDRSCWDYMVLCKTKNLMILVKEVKTFKLNLVSAHNLLMVAKAFSLSFSSIFQSFSPFGSERLLFLCLFFHF